MAVTERRRLFAGRPLWLDTRPSLDCRTLSGSCRADVVVVGAGISGAFLAHALAGRFDRVLVLDRRRPIDGSTVASTSLLQFEIDQPLIRLAEKIGWTKARQAWGRSFAATRALGALIARERIACGHGRRQTLYLAGDVMGHRALAAEAAARDRAGLPGTFLSKAGLRDRFGIQRTGAILSTGAAVADPALRDAAGRQLPVGSEAAVNVVGENPRHAALPAPTVADERTGRPPVPGGLPSSRSRGD